MKEITVIILAAGDSTRFWPLGDKNRLLFLGENLVYKKIKQFSKYGFSTFLIVVNKESNVYWDELKKDFSKLKIDIAIQEKTEGMDSAILSCGNYIQNKKILIISPNDVYEEYLISDFVKLYKQDPDGVIVGKSIDEYYPGGYITQKNGLVTSIVEKPKVDKVPSNVVNIVFHYIKNANIILKAIKDVKFKRDDLYEQALQSLINQGVIFRLQTYRGFWGYLKYPWHVLQLTDYFLNNIKESKIKKVKIQKNVHISGLVVLEDDVTIMENSQIIGPVFIGQGTTIGQNSLIRQSVVGNKCMVGFSTEIARSYIGNNCYFHKNYIGDSVIMDNLIMGAGAILANYRLDGGKIKSMVEGERIGTGRIKLGAMIGKDVRLGINSSIMPGIKIGENSVVGSAVLLDKDIENNRFVWQKSSYIKKVINKLAFNKK